MAIGTRDLGRLRPCLAAAVLLSACAGIEGSPIGTAGQAGTETTPTADGDPSTVTATMTGTPPGDDGQNDEDDGPPGDPSGTGGTSGGEIETTSLGLDGSSTGDGPPMSGTTSGGGDDEGGTTRGNDLVTGTSGNTDTDTSSGTGSGTDTGTSSSTG